MLVFMTFPKHCNPLSDCGKLHYPLYLSAFSCSFYALVGEPFAKLLYILSWIIPGFLAQLINQGWSNPVVVGSNPIEITKTFFSASCDPHMLARANASKFRSHFQPLKVVVTTNKVYIEKLKNMQLMILVYMIWIEARKLKGLSHGWTVWKV